MQQVSYRPAVYLTPIVLALVLVLTADPVVGATTETFESEWFENDIEVDGNLEDWAGSLTYVPEHDFTLGVRNDGEFLYIALMLDSPMLGMRAIMNGLTLSFDPDGGESKALGVRFPLSARELVPSGSPQGSPPQGSTPEDGPPEGSAPEGGPPEVGPPEGGSTEGGPQEGDSTEGGPQEGDSTEGGHPEGDSTEGGHPEGEDGGRRGGLFHDPERLRAHLDRASYELDLLDAEGNARRLGTDAAAKTEGIVVALAEKHRTLYYEMKIPLQAGKGRASAIGAKAGKNIGFTIESPALEPREPPRPRSRGWGNGRGGGRIGGRGGLGRRGRRRGGHTSGSHASQSFEFVATIKPAGAPKQ